MNSNFFQHSPSRLTGQRGWTLIELMGALAVGAMVLALLTPALQGQLERTARIQEMEKLSQIATEFRQQIRRQGQVPHPTAIAGFVAPSLGWRTEEVLTNARVLSRAMLFDPECRIGPITNRAFPFVQTESGSAEPVRPRCVWVSSLGEPLPTFLTNGAILETAAFEALWQSDPGTFPADWSWPGRGEDLLIERLDLREEFVSLTLNNPGSDQPRFSVSAHQTAILAPGLFRSWYLRGTTVQLMDATGALQTVESIQGPTGWQYEGGKWRRAGAWSGLPGAPSGRDFAEAAELFLRRPVPPHVSTNASLWVLTALTNFTASYETWVAAGFPTPLVSESAPIRAWEELRQATANLLAEP